MPFRYYDQAELDRQYFIRGTVEDLDAILEAYSRRTAEVRQRIPCHLDMAYGGGVDERLDIYPSQAPTEAGAPVFVFIHGGFWRALSAADSGFMAEAFSQQGACVVSINYALAPQASMDDIVQQCRNALVWIYQHIRDYGGDPDRIYVGGSSAGGHLAGMMLADGWTARAGVPGLQVRGGLLLSGLYDLEPLLETHVNAWARMDRESARRNSPIRHLPAQGVPLIFSYAPNETEEFKRQTESYLAACAASGAVCQFVAAPGTNHFDICFEMADARSAMMQRTLAVMGLALPR